MKTFRTFLVGVALVVGGAACSSVEDSAEYKTVAKTIDDLRSKIETAKQEVATWKKSSETNKTKRATEEKDLRTDVSNAKAERDKFYNAVADVLMDNHVRARAIQELWKPACLDTVKLLLESEGEVDGEDAQWDWIEGKQSDRNDYWYSLGGADSTEPEGFRKIAADVDVAWNSCNQEATRKFSATCETVDKLILKKSPDRFKGKCLTGAVRIVQMDSNTGECSFQGFIGGGYDVQAKFGMTLSPATQQTSKDCEWADRLKENMTITFWAYGLGAYSYKTTNNGSATVPAFKLIIYRG